MATVGLICLILALGGSVLAQIYPDNRGTEFVVGYMANYKLELSPELFVTTSKTTRVTVTVTAPMFPDAGLHEVFTVTEGEVKQIFIDNIIRAVGTAKEQKGILVTATDEVVVYGTNVERFSNDAFLAFPVDVLGNEYYIASHYPSTMECEFMLVGVYDSTNVTIDFGTHPLIDVEYNGVHYHNNSVMSILLNRLDTFQVQTYGDLTGSYILSDRDVVVFSGNKFTSVVGSTRDHLVDQMLPVHTWGKMFVTVPIPFRLIFKGGDEVKFIASEDATFVQVNCSRGYNVSFTIDAGNYDEYLLPSDECCAVNATAPIMVILIVLSQFDKTEPADPALITIPPVEQYAADYTLATPKYSQGLYQNFAMVIVKESLKDGLLVDGGPVPANTTYTSVPGTDYVGGFFEVSDGTHSFRHMASSVFGLFMYGTAKWETYGMPGGLSLAHINGWCDLSFTPVDGDGIDNDCDDLIDEEDCSPENNGTDDDGDGYVDEDCALPPPINGSWTEWSPWSMCSISCTPLGGNITSGVKTRIRTCTDPKPEYGGFACVENDSKSVSCTENMTCPIHGNWSSWGAWGQCSVTCGNGTQTRNRTCTNPAPDYGGDNCPGSGDETAICDSGVFCPVDGGWGNWLSWGSCSQTCGVAGGASIRTRACDSPAAQYGGANCSGDWQESVVCNAFYCPIDGDWSTWSAWSSCGGTCGNSSSYRNRTCGDPAPQFNGSDCSGPDSELQSCYTGIMCPVDGGFSDWTSWDACTVSCAGGTQKRTRSCTSPAPLYLGAPCVGQTEEQRDCNIHHCPVNGNWTEWSEWGLCSSVCGQGVTVRYRSCSNPVPRYNGSDCFGDPTETAACNGTCSVHGGWGEWNSWSPCTQTCGIGHRARVRICDNPVPMRDGSPCFGDSILFESCSTRACIGPEDSKAYGKFSNFCPERYFSCKEGGISCVEQSFRCDCVPDCDDGSDESVDWAACSGTLHTYCEKNSAYGGSSAFPYLFVSITLVKWTIVT